MIGRAAVFAYGVLSYAIFFVTFLVMIAFFFNNPTVNVVVNGIWTIMLLLVLVDAVVLSILLRRLMKREFPESVRRASHIGYGVTRALTMRWMRLPRPQVRIGGAPKEPRR